MCINSIDSSCQEASLTQAEEEVFSPKEQDLIFSMMSAFENSVLGDLMPACDRLHQEKTSAKKEKVSRLEKRVTSSNSLTNKAEIAAGILTVVTKIFSERFMQNQDPYIRAGATVAAVMSPAINPLANMFSGATGIEATRNQMNTASTALSKDQPTSAKELERVWLDAIQAMIRSIEDQARSL